MKFRIGQTCYLTGGFSWFLKETGLELPLKCKIQGYSLKENSYDVFVVEPNTEVNFHELSDGSFMKMSQVHSLIGVDPKNLIGSV